MFLPDAPPVRAHLSHLSDEEVLKVRQALPSFHAAQREMLFSHSPIIVEGPKDSTILLNVAAKLDMPLGAAGIGVASMGGKYQLLAFRALCRLFAKPEARFVLDLDAVTDASVLHCLDDDSAVIEYLATAGSGDQTLSKLAGELIGLIKDYVSATAEAGNALESVDATQELNAKDLAIALQVIARTFHRAPDDLVNRSDAETILGKLNLVRAAAHAANVLILSKGPMEAYYENCPGLRPNDFKKQQAFQSEFGIDLEYGRSASS